jgi:tagaturonate reductase
MQIRPETVLQFGAGNFLRAFVDVFIHEANTEGQNVGRVVVVQSTNSNRATLLNAQNGCYHVITRGLSNGQKIDSEQRIESISRALIASTEWDAVLNIGRSPDLRFITSNVTEAGLTLEPNDSPDLPTSFPGKLEEVLYARYTANLPGTIIAPCELVDRNADCLKNLVLKQAHLWNRDPAFTKYLETKNTWCNTLVDRIVSGRPESHPLLDEDALLTVAEPFALWVIENTDLFQHPAIQSVPNVDPFSIRKVRVLNGAHTALVSKAIPLGIETVREAVEHATIGPWLRNLIFDEIVPVVSTQVDGVETFAEQVLERFANPFLNHYLKDIALHHDTKVQVRLISTYNEYIQKFGQKPPLLHGILTDYL